MFPCRVKFPRQRNKKANQYINRNVFSLYNIKEYTYKYQYMKQNKRKSLLHAHDA